MGRRTTVTKTELDTDEVDEQEREEETHLDAPLFADRGATGDKKIASIDVSRLEPEEGFLGKMDPTSTQSQIYEKWGGGKFAIVAKNDRGRIVTRDTVLISGEPMFQSEVAEARWRRANGLKPKGHTDTAGGEFNAREMMALMETKAAEARRESEEREARRRQDDEDRTAKREREEREWRERMDRERDEREAKRRQEEREWQARQEENRRKDDERRETQRRDDEKAREARIREEESRREKEHERQLEQARLASKESTERQQQWFTNMMAMAKQEAGGGGAMDALTKGIELALMLRPGGDDDDAVTSLVKRLPEVLGQAKDLVVSGVREARGLGPAGGDEEEETESTTQNADGKIVLTGQAAAKLRALIEHLVKQGKNPEQVLSAAADMLMGKAPNPAVIAAIKAAQAEQRARAAAEAGEAPKPPRKRRPKPAPKPAAATAAPTPPTSPMGKPAGAP